MGICAYIDILGFKNFVNENSEGAIKVLQNYQVQLQFLDKFPKGDTYTTPYKTDSFNYLVPFSDSIFFYSEKPSEFVMQLSNFVNGSFSFTSDAFSNPEDAEHPENVNERGAVMEEGKVVMKNFPSKWYPLLFRGGIGFGDARVMELHCIHNGEKKKTPFVFGNSVIEAVKMETVQVNNENIKGPRILCTSELYNQLNERAKKIVHPAFDKPEFYEVNWTAVHYLMTDDPNPWFVNQLLMNDFYLHMLVPASSLWRAYRNTATELHYRNFIKLIVKGVQHYFSGTEYLNQVNIYIKESIEKENLSEISDYLLN
jgi:hypothetical protein